MSTADDDLAPKPSPLPLPLPLPSSDERGQGQGQGNSAKPAPLPFLIRTWWASIALVVAGFIFFLVVSQIFPSVIIAVCLVLTKAIRLGVMPDQSAIERAIAGYVPTLTAFSPLAAGMLVYGLRFAGQLAPSTTPALSAARSLAWLAVAAPVALFGARGIEWVQRVAFDREITEQTVIVEAFKQVQGRGYFCFVIAVVIFAPLGEEGFFRRFAFATLKSGCGRVTAYVITMLLFAAIHLNFSAFFVYAWLAFWCAFLYERTGRIETAIALHAINNGLACISNS